jgi:hypothetical protein
MNESKTIQAATEISDAELTAVVGGEEAFVSPNLPGKDELPESALNGIAGGTSRPPSGDSNPSDLTNTTVSSDQIINPHP